MTPTFQIDSRLDADSRLVARQDGCQIRLVDDARFFWLLVVPEDPGLRELHDLPPERLAAVMLLAGRLGRAVQAATGAHKMNTAAIGNLVAQLHIHVVARRTDDPAWPQPVWGNGAAVPLTAEERAARIALIGSILDRPAA